MSRAARHLSRHLYKIKMHGSHMSPKTQTIFFFPLGSTDLVPRRDRIPSFTYAWTILLFVVFW